MWIDGLSVHDKKTGINWKWQVMGARVNTKAPLWEKGSNSVDRAKSDTKHVVLVDGKEIPPSMSIDGANIHSTKVTECTFQEVVLS